MAGRIPLKQLWDPQRVPFSEKSVPMPITKDILYHTSQQLKHSCRAAQDQTIWPQIASACAPTDLGRGNSSIRVQKYLPEDFETKKSKSEKVFGLDSLKEK